MRDKTMIEKLGKRIGSLEDHTLKLQKQLRDVNNILCKLLHEMNGTKLVEMQKPDRDRLVRELRHAHPDRLCKH